MPRFAFLIVVLSLCSLSDSVSGLQPQDSVTAEPDAEHITQLETCREGLLDAKARPEDRRRWAKQLLSYPTPEAATLIVNLLGMSEHPEVQRAVCGELARRGGPEPQRLDGRFVDPLMALLGAKADDLRLTAALALSEYPGADVPGRLGALAARGAAPMPERLAAITALTPNTHRREVVGQLIGLLDTGAPEVTELVIVALQSVSSVDFGPDADLWSKWWQRVSRLSEEAWLAEQLRIYRERFRRTTVELDTYRETTRREYKATTTRLYSFQRELFRTLSSDGRAAKLVEWLADPLPVVKRSALAIIKSNIADEGQRPAGEVLSALLGLLRQGSPEVRREVLDIVQNLSDPSVEEHVLAQLEREDDAHTRLAIFKAIGTLNSPDAVPVLIREIAASDGCEDCAREAAVALGQVAAKADITSYREDAVSALAKRYRSEAFGEWRGTSPGKGTGPSGMRSALLSAMAGVGDRAFLPTFLEALESDDATILRPAIGGVLAVRNASKLQRLRSLTAHTDPLVRLAAIEAVGKLGREEADLESLLTRLNPTIEASEPARDAAWVGFRELLGSKQMDYRIRAAQRLRDLPELEVKYLEELANDAEGLVPLPAADGTLQRDWSPSELETILERLAASLISQGRHAEAIAPQRRVYEMRSSRTDAGAWECGLLLLEVTLRGIAEGLVPGGLKVADLITQLAVSAPGEPEIAQIVAAVGTYLDSLVAGKDLQHARRVLAELRSVTAEGLGTAWTELLERTAAHLEPPDVGTDQAGFGKDPSGFRKDPSGPLGSR